MNGLSKNQIDAIINSMNELDDFKEKVIGMLKKKKINQNDLDEIMANLRYIESNTAYISDLLASYK